MSKPPKRIHRPPPVDGMAACIVLQKGKWQRMQVACHPVDAEAVSQLLSGCGPKCVTDFVKNGPKKIQKKKKKPRDTDSLDGDDDFFDIGPIFSTPAVTAAPAPTKAPEVDPDFVEGSVRIEQPEFEVVPDRTSPFVRPFKVKARKKIDVKKHMRARRAFQTWVNSLRQRQGSITEKDLPAMQSQFDKIVEAEGAGHPLIWNVKEGRFDPSPSNPAAASNPTGTVSGLSSRRPTMARRKACSVLRRQGKKLPKRCKGTKRKSRR